MKNIKEDIKYVKRCLQLFLKKILVTTNLQIKVRTKLSGANIVLRKVYQKVKFPLKVTYRARSEFKYPRIGKIIFGPFYHRVKHQTRGFDARMVLIRVYKTIHSCAFEINLLNILEWNIESTMIIIVYIYQQ